jgi:hypothetical protein
MDETTGNGKAQGVLSTEGDVTLERSLVGVVRARDVHLTQAASGPVAASGGVTIHQGGCGPVVTGGDVSITQGGCGPMIVRGNVSIEQGGTQSVIAAGGATIGDRSFVGFVMSPSVTVETGGKVLMSTPQALAFGAAFGLVTAVLGRMFRR